jgi:hypothetical protein
MRRFPILSVAVLCLGALALGQAVVPPARASQPQVVADCNSHGRLTQTYSDAQLRNALSTMSADVKEYTDCYDVIQRALLAQLGGSHQRSDGSNSGSGGSFLPTPLIVLLVLLALGAVTFGAVAIRRRGAGGAPDGP